MEVSPQCQIHLLQHRTRQQRTISHTPKSLLVVGASLYNFVCVNTILSSSRATYETTFQLVLLALASFLVKSLPNISQERSSTSHITRSTAATVPLAHQHARHDDDLGKPLSTRR